MVFRSNGVRVAKLTGHSAAVTQIGWAGENRLVTVAQDGSGRVWQLDSDVPLGGRQIGLFVGHTIDLKRERIGSEVSCLDVSPDGLRAVSGDASGNVLLWDVGSCKLIRALRKVPHLAEEDDMANVVRFFPDGSKVAVGTDGGQMEVLDTQTGKLVAGKAFFGMPGMVPPKAMVNEHFPTISSLDVSPDGRFVAYRITPSGPTREHVRIRVLDVATSKIIGELSETQVVVDGIKMGEPHELRPDETIRLGLGSPFFVEGGHRILLPLGYAKVALWDPQLPAEQTGKGAAKREPLPRLRNE